MKTGAKFQSRRKVVRLAMIGDKLVVTFEQREPAPGLNLEYKDGHQTDQLSLGLEWPATNQVFRP
jgi:hypothetical protein